MIDKEDWRLTGQEEYLKDVALLYRQWSAWSPNWDHDHCEFCLAKFSDKIPGCLTEGYTTIDNYRWICLGCFADFRDYFDWKVSVP